MDIQEVIEWCKEVRVKNYDRGEEPLCFGCKYYTDNSLKRDYEKGISDCYFRNYIPINWDYDEVRRRMGKEILRYKGKEILRYKMTLEVPGWDIINYPPTFYLVQKKIGGIHA